MLTIVRQTDNYSGGKWPCYKATRLLTSLNLSGLSFPPEKNSIVKNGKGLSRNLNLNKLAFTPDGDEDIQVEGSLLFEFSLKDLRSDTEHVKIVIDFLIEQSFVANSFGSPITGQTAVDSYNQMLLSGNTYLIKVRIQKLLTAASTGVENRTKKIKRLLCGSTQVA